MKIAPIKLSHEDKLREFENWITASIQQISETHTYRYELGKICKILDSLGAATNEFERVEDCDPQQMSVLCIAEIESIISTADSTAAALNMAIELIDALISVLFLVTGKSDNNIKCQFPVYLLQAEGRNVFPIASRKRSGGLDFQYGELGRVIKQEKISKLIAEALVLRGEYSGDIDLESEAVWLLTAYMRSILDSHICTEQLWALGLSYFSLKKRSPGFEGRLLAPIVTFKVRGSVAAQSGHVPERILRRYMASWGLVAGIDFNVDDVVISGNDLQRDDLVEAAAGLHEDSDKEAIDDLNSDPTKTRAYDFVLPYKTEGWVPRIFIQSQFYAGDSGSVSHKVVDQTHSSRLLTVAKYPNAIFIEYLDGAGYYASLYRDLQHMLEMPTTEDFIQVRSAHTKLRRALQNIGFLTPLDFVHALFRRDFSIERAGGLLKEEGYQDKEILRCLQFCLDRGLMSESSGNIKVAPRLLINARRILILDIILVNGVADVDGGDLFVMAPGAPLGHGISFAMLGRIYDEYLGSVGPRASIFSRDLSWLKRGGFIRIASSS